jgi:hypothetical protein
MAKAHVISCIYLTHCIHYRNLADGEYVLIPEQGTIQEENQEQAPEAAIEDLPAAPAIEGKPRFLCITVFIYATLLHLMLVGL